MTLKNKNAKTGIMMMVRVILPKLSEKVNRDQLCQESSHL